PPEHGRGDEDLARLRMTRFELADRRDAVRAHDEMDRAAAERILEPAGRQRDVQEGAVLDQHPDDDLARAGDVRDGDRGARAGCRERLGLRSDDVEDYELVARLEQAARHSLSHSAEADESYFHL